MKYIFGIVLLIATACSSSIEQAREIENFNPGWEFARLEEKSVEVQSGQRGVQTDASWDSQFNIEHIEVLQSETDTISQLSKEELTRLPQLKWEKVMLPHAAFIEDYVVKKQWEGICYYKKSFDVGSADQGKKMFLHFEGAMQVADVWINGKHKKRHLGGYLPFTIDLSNDLVYGEANEIMVRLDNRDHPLLPPGKPLERLDFCYYHGLYRDVKLIKTAQTYITDAVEANQVAGGGIFVTYPKVNEKKATIKVKTHVKNDNSSEAKCKVIQKVLDKTGKVVVRGESNSSSLESLADEHFVVELELENPSLWSPDYPQLYTLETCLVVDGKVVDMRSQQIGIRSIQVSREEGFKINDKPLRLVGTNRHMEYPWVGNAISDEAQYRDLYKIKQAGFNTVRLGHYPQDPSVYEACDELGLLVINPMPGWQFFNKSEIFCERTYQDVRDMVRRDRNYACVVMWETILNESWPPSWWKDKSHAVAHEEYPGDQCITAGDMYGYKGWDVLYNDWKDDHTRPNNSKKPGFIREYGDYEFGGHYSTTRISHGDGEEALLQNAWNLQWSHNKHRAQYPWTIGDANWSFYGYNRGCCDNICFSGNTSILRRPKFATWFYRSQMDVGTKLPNGETMQPEVFIANYWTERQSPSKVVVFGNVDEVALTLNGKEIARQKSDNGPDTPYAEDYEGRINGGNPYDGGNCRNLNHPPFSFNKVNWEMGELKAVGYINGEKVAAYKVNTPLEPVELKIDFDTSGKDAVASGSDVLFVYVSLIDKNGTVCVLDNDQISFELENGKVISPATTDTEAGVATFLIHTTDIPGVILAKAFAGNGYKGENSLEVR